MPFAEESDGDWRIAEITEGAPLRLRLNDGQEAQSRVTARFLDRGDDQIYSVLHPARGERRGAVIQCGPVGIERERTYLTLVEWSRTLADRGFDALRFDYRGTGESTGRFEDMTLSLWREDAAFCAARLAQSSRGVPLVLQGTRLGALIAAELFASGVGDALLLWAPPASAQQLLWETLRHNLVAQRLVPTATACGASAASAASAIGQWRTRDEQVQALEAGELVNVDGYLWSRGLWNDAKCHPLVVPGADEQRPWRAVHPRRRNLAPSESTPFSEAVDADTFWESSSRLLVPHSEGFFRASLSWLDEVARARAA